MPRLAYVRQGLANQRAIESHLQEKSRAARADRAACQQALYRVFDKERFDQSYPFEQYIPEGGQNVPSIRGFKQELPLEVNVYYSTYRAIFHEKKRVNFDHTMNEFVPAFANPFLEWPKKEGPPMEGDKTLATRVLQQFTNHTEPGLQLPGFFERQAALMIHYKPVDMSFEDWVALQRKGN